MNTTPEVQAAVERELARVIASENACEGVASTWADRTRAHDEDRRIILSALTARKPGGV